MSPRGHLTTGVVAVAGTLPTSLSSQRLSVAGLAMLLSYLLVAAKRGN